VTKNAHAEIEKIKAAYIQAYRMVHGMAAADRLTVRYKSGWFYFDNAPISTPYRAHEVVQMTMNLIKRIPQRPDSDDDGSPD
jgi:hypothetical protein